MKNARKLNRVQIRRNSGSALTDFAAAMAVLIPLSILMVSAVVEVHTFILIKLTLDDAARIGARNCAMAYHWPPYGNRQAISGTPGSPDAQGDTVAPPTTSASAPIPSQKVTGTDGGSGNTVGQPRCANDAWKRIRVSNIVNSNTQFSAIYYPASVNSTENPQHQIGHVTVTVSSLPGLGAMPDPLGLRKAMPTMKIESSSTFSL